MRKTLQYTIAFIVLTITFAVGSTSSSHGTTSNYKEIYFQQPDSLKVTEPVDLKYQISDNSGNPLLEEEEQGGLNLSDPSNMDYRAEYDYKTGNVTLYRKVGNMDVRLPYSMPLDDYLDYDTRKSVISYWRQKQQEEANQYGDNSVFNQMWKNVGGEAFEGIFGSNAINVRLQGMAELKVGIQHTKIDNPTLQERLRKTTTFDFQEKIQMNLSGSIGEKLKLGVNYNTEATFDFENQINLEYEGGEDDILKKVEAGNVTLPLPGTLITGSQSLFGVKTEMQFGKLTVTSIFSQQKGETSVMSIEGGAQTQEFEIHADRYDRNRHFFLSKYFRDNYDKALERLPLINSPINVTRVEVWVTNNRSDVKESRNIVGFVDLGENRQHTHNTSLWGGQLNVSPRNEANNLYAQMNSTYNAVRDINKVTATLAPLENNYFYNAIDYEKLENARKLSDTEYSVHPKLGYISLNTSLNADEVLCIAYEYTYNGQTFMVGEFSNSQNEAEQTLFLKLLKPTNLSPGIIKGINKKNPTWDLMMKNIYSINAYQINREDFIMNVTYTNDSTGGDINYLPEGPENVMGQLFIRLMNLDNLNSNNDFQPDGIFDYVDNITIKPDNGRIIFPVLEPFGSNMEKQLGGALADKDLVKKYVFQSLYDSTQILAEQDASRNKYKLKGRYKSSSGSEISLNAMNIPQGSVIVTAGGIRLVENQDYTVDYTLGRVRIINQGILSSGTPIQVSLENQSLFALQTKTLMGTHLDYQFNKNFNVGGTIMHLRERPLTQKVNIGDEPIANTIWGLNTSFYTESMGITEIIDKLPLVETKEMSSVTFEGEFAQLIPGHPKVIDESGTSYIDDFEGTRIPYDMRNWLAWQLASTPQGQEELFKEAGLIDNLYSGINRARLAWYTIDPLFLRKSTQTPGHIKADEEQKKNHFVREVYEQEIFPNREAPYGQPTNLPVLNVAFYPRERGPYNFDAGTSGAATDNYGHGINRDGSLKNPEERWGGMMRQVNVPDFEAANIEYIEFWMMDPYVYDDGIQKNDGKIYFNLGNISEDILRDTRKSFENGLPGPGEPFDVDSTNWGYVPRKQNLVNAFSNDPATRLAQDVGLNGMNSAKERYFYRKQPYAFLNVIESMGGDLDEAARQALLADPASDDYLYFLGGMHDENETSILDRYKLFNNPEGNSLPSEFEGDGTKRAAKALPDMEDINEDNTLSENESYFQYEIPISKNTMSIEANPYIVDKRESTVEDKNGVRANWYQFRIPIQNPTATIGSIRDLRSIRFMRMFMKGFSDTTILRMATLDLIKADWRKFTESLYENGAGNADTKFEVSVVNIEESSEKTPVNYVLPPGIDRVIDPANPQLRELNEQSLLLKVLDLAGGDARAVYKNVSIDIRQYKRMKMFIHAEDVDDRGLLDNEMMAFIRVGSDYNDNYYEYEIPLKLTPKGRYNNNNIDDRYKVWPEENEMNIPLELFQTVKLRRNDEKRQEGSSITFNQVYIMPDPETPTNFVSVRGNPNLSNIRTITMGVRTRGSTSKSVEVWMNELRLTDFNEEGGWAANARMTVKLADLGNVSVAGKKSTVGWGSIDQNVQERSQEDFFQYDIATNLELGKLLGPESALSVPFYFGYSKSVASPKYYPLDPDIPLDVALDNAENEAARDSIKDMSQNVIKRKSVNFTNVKLLPKKEKVHFYSPSNISATYSYNETTRHDVDTDHSTDKNYRGILAYNYNARPKAVEPFKKSFNSNALALVRDFNFYYLPNQISYSWEFDRQYREIQLRNNTGSPISPALTVSKDFDWNRHFDMRYNLTKSLKLNFRAITNARIDEPEGAVNKDYDRDAYYDWRDEVWRNIKSMGRTTTYQHNFDVSYTLPINKIPMLDFTSATLQYRGMYQWEAQPLFENESDSPDWGNTIRNSNVVQANGQLNMTTLYKKVSYLNELDKKYRSSRRRTSSNNDGKRTVRYNQTNVKLDKDAAITINHKLKTTETSVRVFDATGKPVRGQVNTLGKNKVEFVPEKSVENARVMVTGTVTENNSPMQKVVDYTALLMTSIKNMSVSYSEQNGTILPGYTPVAGFMGTSTGFTAPGVPFILGWQDRNFAIDAANNGWLTDDTTMVNPYVMTHGEDFSIKFTLEPIRGLRVDLNADRSYERNINEYYFGGSSTATGRTANGRFSMSFNAFKTAFDKPERTGALTSSTFDEFKSNRQIIANRLGTTDLNDQEVLIPAFLAAYSGKSANSIFTEQFPSLSRIQPNWRVTYDGLSRIKAFQKVIKSFDLTHAYRSTYNMGAYISRTPPEADGVITEYDVNAITITEQFSPLIGVNVTWTNSITTRAEIKKARTLSLSMGNNQVIENYNDELVIGLGYRFDKMNLIFGKGSSQKSISNDLNIRADFSIQDNISFIRKIQEDYNQLTAGLKITSVKFTADYALSERFNMQLFYDTKVNTPYVSLSYPITNSNFGVSFRFSLAQ
ncbi:cell surface protein SprA [Carboxylicivirga mesophila]|uniref:Cell surface protein SprA n=1 Tax=Carboxylicivirga mesophila TaxID=1166478 RepID=A0ABS5K5K2_9BACT|nr:cell surface protein SprA [Carboxylicivirga mesophila]MBS2210253.1 cell surface protein SprA [Carboxylicivirga mesophila]